MRKRSGTHCYCGPGCVTRGQRWKLRQWQEKKALDLPRAPYADWPLDKLDAYVTLMLDHELEDAIRVANR